MKARHAAALALLALAGFFIATELSPVSPFFGYVVFPLFGLVAIWSVGYFVFIFGKLCVHLIRHPRLKGN